MRIIPVVLATLVLSATVADAKKMIDPVETALTALERAAKCSDPASPLWPWCIATKFSTGKLAPLPKKTLIGITVELEDGKDAADALTNKVTFVAFAVGKDGKVKLVDIKPDGAEEAKSVAEAVAGVAMVFKGKAKSAKLPKDVGDYVKGLAGKYEVTKGTTGYVWTNDAKGTSQLTKVGKFWVIVEQPATANGIWATVLTESWN